MRRLIYGSIITAAYTFSQYLMLTEYDSLILHMLPVITLGLAMSLLWDIGFKAGLERGVNCVEDES